MSDEVQDDRRLAAQQPTPADGLSEQEALSRRAMGLGNDAVIRTGRSYTEILRGGRERVVDQREAVLGDALVVRLGDQLMLDGRVLAGAMEVDESLLTGEADRIPKRTGDEVLSGSVCTISSRPRNRSRLDSHRW